MQKRYNKFILKGSLALESYHDVNNDNHELFINYNKIKRLVNIIYDQEKSFAF